MNQTTSGELRSLRLEHGGRDLLVLLPGAYMRPEDFVAAGFFAAVETAGANLDLCAVDLDLLSISSGQALPALRRGILEPARIRYRHVWLGGISLGGLLALCQASEGVANDALPGIDGLCLLAPYPGSRLTTNAIAAAGGLAKWQASTEQLADPEFRVWQWLKSPPANLPVFVGYGCDDRFADGMCQLAECFPPTARCTVPGTHDWPAWRQLWETFLAAGHFPR